MLEEHELQVEGFIHTDLFQGWIYLKVIKNIVPRIVFRKAMFFGIFSDNYVMKMMPA